MGAEGVIGKELADKLAGVPGALDDLKRSFEKEIAASRAAATDADVRAIAAAALAKAANEKADQILAKIDDASFRLPGAEEDVKRGKVTVGHFIAARAIMDCIGGEDGKARAERMFPIVFDIDRETRKRLTEAAQQRTQVTHTDSLGGLLVPDEVSATVIDFAYAATCLSKLNFTRVTNARGKTYSVRKMTGSGTVYMSGETPGSSSVAKTTISFGRANMAARKIIAIGAVSKELDQLSNPSALAALERDFREKIALKMEQQVFEGAGGEFEVRGLDKYTAAADGINTFDATGTDNGSVASAANGRDLTAYFMQRLAQVVEAANGLAAGGRMQYLMPTKLKQVLSLQQMTQFSGQKPDTGSMPALGLSLVTDAQLEALFGPIAHSTQFKTNRTIGGSSDGGLVGGGEFRNSWLVEWGGFELSRADTAVLSNAAGAVTLNAFQDEAVLVKATLGFDAAHVRPSDLVLATGFRTVRSGV